MRPIVARTSLAAMTFAWVACGVGAGARGIVWKAGDPTLGHWKIATDYQCGKPQQDGSRFTFSLDRNGRECARNQANPTIDDDGDVVRLRQGHIYTWTFRYIDGAPHETSLRMGPDHDARSLIWQMHNYASTGGSASLGFTNAPSGEQQWYLSISSGYQWTGAYTPGETDDWKIVVLVSNGPDGRVTLYRNGARVASVSGANFTSPLDPWWNFGPYKWRWELADGGGSSMNAVECTIDGMTLVESDPTPQGSRSQRPQ